MVAIVSSRTTPRDISLPLLIGLSVVMLIFSGSLYAGEKPPVPKDAPILTNFRDPDTGEAFFAHRLEVAPILYGLLHAVPAAIWSLAMPIQHSSSLRRKYPTLHRWSGRLGFSMGLCLNVTGLVLIARKLSFSAPFWELHKWGPLYFPSFSLSSAVLGLVWPTFLIQAYRTARSKRWAEHRRWATGYTILGYLIMIERVALIATAAVGILLTHLPAIRQRLSLPDVGLEGYKTERAAFAFGNVIAYVATAVWFVWLFHTKTTRDVKAKKVL